jgi:ATP/maltotriose-dependent transcriptional regulator MalT
MALRFQQKLVVPAAVSPHVERAELLEQLDQEIASMRVVALAAPAGWGKTTTLAQWVARNRLTVARYTLDCTDRERRIFLDYFLQAVAYIVPGFHELARGLLDASPKALPELFRQSALAIAAAPTSFVLVLDDLHALDDSPHGPAQDTLLIREFLVALIDYAPSCKLVLASRTLVSLFSLERLVRLGAQQQAAVLDYKALQFSPSETQSLARLINGDALADDRAEQLATDLNGWVAGLVLSLSQSRSTRSFVTVDTEDSAAPLHAFFAEQILAPLAPELQQFLEDTSVVEDLSPARSDRLREAQDSARFLNDIATRVLFVSRRASWLTYHSLFRDFLRTRLARNPARERILLCRAGDLYRDEEDIERALDCYLAADEEALALGLLRQMISPLRERSRHSTLLTCFERLSDAVARHGRARLLPADLLLEQAYVYSDLALWERARLAIQLAETIGDDEIQAQACLIDADIWCMRQDPARAQEILDTIEPAALSLRARLFYYFTAGRLRILRGDIQAAIVSLEQAQSLAPCVAASANDPRLLAMIYDSLGWAYGIQGDCPAAIRHLQRADACWQTCSNHGRRTMTLNNLGMMALAERRYAEARSAFETGLDLAQQTARRREEAVLRCSLAELEVGEGRLDQALARFAEAHALAVRVDIAESAAAAAAGAFWVAALQGDGAAAQHWQSMATTTAGISTQPEIYGRQALGRALLSIRLPECDLGMLAALVAETMTIESALQAPERACLALIHAAIVFERSGWPGAAPAWEQFDRQAAHISDSLLQHFTLVFGKLFDAAAQSSPLARRFGGTLPKPPAIRWHIRALGAFSCQVDGTHCDLSPLHLALLVRLLDAGPAGTSIERLWMDVWGDSFHSMPTLHQTLYRFRSQTKLAVKVRDGICAIRSDWSTIDYDVRALEQILATPLDEHTIGQATTLYRGDFLPGAPLSAALWADARRAYLQQRFLDALDRFAHTIERDSPGRAIEYYQHILQLDGGREQTAAQLIRLATRIGNRSLVNATFDLLTGTLRALGTTPQPSTTALYQDIS